MGDTPPNASTAVTARPPFLPALLLLFVGSGCAALIYEIVWLQLLQLVIGSTAVSLGVLLGTFMGGMCLGSLLLPRLISARRHPLRVYALLELGIGLLGIVLVNGMPYVEELYSLYGGHGLPGILLRAAVAGLCLLPPTLLMGATLPAIARWVETSREGVSWLGFFYGGNIVGAVFGCLLAGFYLLRVHDMPTATYAAFGVNVAVAVTALCLSAFAPYAGPAVAPTAAVVRRAPGAWAVYVAIALSGMSALGAEVVWTRLLSLLLGGTVYTFSIILAVFLVGLGIGSSLGALCARTARSPRLALGVCQMLLVGAIAWTAFMLAKSLPYWPINPSLTSNLPAGPWYTFQLDMVRCLWAVLPPAILWGASFPLALAGVAARGQDAGRLVGGVYAANTVGAIIGALAFSMVVIPWIGTAAAERVLIGLSALAAALATATALVPLLLGAPYEDPPQPVRPAAAVGVAVALTLSLFAGGLLAWTASPVPWEMVAYGRQMMMSPDTHLIPGVVDEDEIPFGEKSTDVYCTYVGEGMNVSVAVTENTEGYRYFHGAGKVQASTAPQDMRLQRMLGHLSALLHKKPEKVLVVACGAGVTAGSFVVHPEVKKVVICDIEPLVPKTVTPMFGDANYHIVDGMGQQNPRTIDRRKVTVPRDGQRHHLFAGYKGDVPNLEVEVVYDDGRHFIRTTKEKFDIITSDPIDPWVKGCAALNTVEYYRMCKEHLNPGGVMSLWIPFYESNLDTAKSVLATFFKVFPHGIVWSNDNNGLGYDAVLFGQAEPTVIDVDELAERLNRPDQQEVRASLQEVGFGVKHQTPGVVVIGRGPAVELLATYAGQAKYLEEWSKDAQINTDRNLRLQYLAGMWLNTQMASGILSSILKYYRFPEETFKGSPQRLAFLRAALADNHREEPTKPAAKPPGR
jgi:spermidine synthase